MIGIASIMVYSIIQFVLSLSLLVIMIIQMQTCERRGESIAWLTVAINGMLFAGALIIDKLDGIIDPYFYNTWVGWFLVHFLTILVAVEAARMIRILRARRMNHGC